MSGDIAPSPFVEMKDLVIIEQLPEVPADWNYEESVARVKQVIYKWKNLTLELATELYIAREALRRQGLRNKSSEVKTWSDYCEEVGNSRQVIDRWLRRWFPLEKGVTKVTPLLPEGLFNVIYADPPWRYDFSKVDAWAVEVHYPTLDLEAIKYYKDDNGTPIQSKFAEDAVLFLWAPQPKLKDALEVIEVWGFQYTTGAVWVKDRLGMGYWWMQKHELLLLAKKGNFPAPHTDNRPPSVIEEPWNGHSKKPESIYEMIEQMCPLPTRYKEENHDYYLELFKRGHKRPFWAGWGQEYG